MLPKLQLFKGTLLTRKGETDEHKQESCGNRGEESQGKLHDVTVLKQRAAVLGAVKAGNLLSSFGLEGRKSKNRTHDALLLALSALS